jgi:hypothetical protein
MINRNIEMNKTTIVLAFTTVALSLGAVSSASALTIKPGPGFPGASNKHEASSTYSCGNDLGYLRRVHAEEISALQFGARVSISPVCEDGERSLRNEGNAGALRRQIAETPVLATALADKAYRAEDVVGVRVVGDNVVILYVQHSTY